jgi:hypothetical protein
MAVAIITTDFPAGVGPDVYDAVGAVLGVEADPPEGLIFHWAGEVDGTWTFSEVWESREACDRFRRERLYPLMQQVSGIPVTAIQPTMREYPVHNYEKP